MTEQAQQNLRTDFVPIRIEDFEERTGIALRTIDGCREVERIVSPRDMAAIKDVRIAHDDYRDQVLQSIGLAAAPAIKPYRALRVAIRMVDPSEVLVGQKYAYWPNIESIIEGFRETLKGFGTIRGFLRTPGVCLLIGEDRDGTAALAQFFPPIVEQHGSKLFLMDGVHRTFLARSAGVQIDCLVIYDVETRFPCAPHRWQDVKPVHEKPLRAEDRYFDLDAHLFRDVKYSGIDG